MLCVIHYHYRTFHSIRFYTIHTIAIIALTFYQDNKGEQQAGLSGHTMQHSKWLMPFFFSFSFFFLFLAYGQKLKRNQVDTNHAFIKSCSADATYKMH